MASLFEQALRNVIQMSGISYVQLAKEANVDPSQIGKFMAGKRGLNVETVGKICDCIGTTLTPPFNRFRPKPTGRPPKILHVSDIHLERRKPGASGDLRQPVRPVQENSSEDRQENSVNPNSDQSSPEESPGTRRNRRRRVIGTDQGQVKSAVDGVAGKVVTTGGETGDCS